jgi:hypothetical protein
MLSHPNFFMVLPKQLSADYILVFRNDTHQPIHIFGMVPNQLGQLLNLPFQLLQAPSHVACRAG